jgi:anti-sigma-K factor RskA
MIDERHEELAALYAFDLLEGVEKTAFEAAVARDPALQTLVRELRESSAALAHLAPGAMPPPELKKRLLAELDRRSAAAAPPNKIIAFPSWIPWAAAACFALIAAGAGQLYLTSRTEAQSLRDQQALADATLKSVRNQFEAERIVTRQQLTTLTQQNTEAAQQLADARRTVDDTTRQLAEARTGTTDAQRLLAEATRRSEGTERLLAATRVELADLGRELKVQGDVANLKITTLASMLNNSPQALAVAVWNSASQEGVLKVEKLPALAADKDYQLWVVDPQYQDPIDAGTFTVDPKTGEARVQFKTKQPIRAIAAYAITQERKGGVVKSAGPFLLLGKEAPVSP